MTIRAVVFDRDGVLTDFDGLAAYDFFSPLLPIPIEKLNDHWFHWGDMQGAPTNLEEESFFWEGFWVYLRDELGLSADVYEQLRAVDYTRFIFAFPETRKTLQMVKKQGFQIGVLSNFSLASLDDSLLNVGLRDLIDATCAATIIGVSKPHPKAYHIMMEALKVQPHECLFFDDEMPNVEGARAVGMHAYYVDRSQASHDLSMSTVCDLSVIPEIARDLVRTVISV